MSPKICQSVEGADYAARAEALRLLAELPGDEYESALDAVIQHPRIREILHCAVLMAYAGFAEYYHDDAEWIDSTLRRELAAAEDLACQTVCQRCGKPIEVTDAGNFGHGTDFRVPTHADCDEGD